MRCLPFYFGLYQACPALDFALPFFLRTSKPLCVSRFLAGRDPFPVPAKHRHFAALRKRYAHVRQLELGHVRPFNAEAQAQLRFLRKLVGSYFV